MTIERLLAKLLAGSAAFASGPGGIPEITTAELNAARGYAQSDLIKASQAPAPLKQPTPIGILLVDAKWLDDEGSLRELEKRLPQELFNAWWSHDADSDAAVSRLLFRRLAKVLAQEYTRSDPVNRLSEGKIAHQVGVNYRTWKRKFQRFYGEQFKELDIAESEALTRMRARLFERIN